MFCCLSKEGTWIGCDFFTSAWRVVPSDQPVCLTSLSGGTTWHAVGLLGQLRSIKEETQLSEYGCELYSKLEEETGLGTGENSGEWKKMLYNGCHFTPPPPPPRVKKNRLESTQVDVWTSPKTRCRLDLSDIAFSWSCQLRSQGLVDLVYWLLLVAGFKRCGSLIVARTKERMSLLRRNADQARWGQRTTNDFDGGGGGWHDNHGGGGGGGGGEGRW